MLQRGRSGFSRLEEKAVSARRRDSSGASAGNEQPPGGRPPEGCSSFFVVILSGWVQPTGCRGLTSRRVGETHRMPGPDLGGFHPPCPSQFDSAASVACCMAWIARILRQASE